MIDPYCQTVDSLGVFIPAEPVQHQEEQYDPAGHDLLVRMQRDHFWYRGRHRFLLKAVQRWAVPRFPSGTRPSIADLGGGCGGWVKYLSDHNPWPDCEIGLTDSSVEALGMAKPLLPKEIKLYQTDLMNLQWQERWDIVFLLDVLEHLPEPEAAFLEIKKSLKPGGLLFVTVPALQAFWSIVDEFGHHQKRYHIKDFEPLAKSTGMELLDSRYFMFFLSPLVYLSRVARKNSINDAESLREFNKKHHAVPPKLLNELLAGVFRAETPVGHHVRFPWGTSAFSVFMK